jgi:hypothetical protein
MNYDDFENMISLMYVEQIREMFCRKMEQVDCEPDALNKFLEEYNIEARVKTVTGDPNFEDFVITME